MLLVIIANASFLWACTIEFNEVSIKLTTYIDSRTKKHQLMCNPCNSAVTLVVASHTLVILVTDIQDHWNGNKCHKEAKRITSSPECHELLLNIFIKWQEELWMGIKPKDTLGNTSSPAVMAFLKRRRILMKRHHHTKRKWIQFWWFTCWWPILSSPGCWQGYSQGGSGMWILNVTPINSMVEVVSDWSAMCQLQLPMILFEFKPWDSLSCVLVKMPTLLERQCKTLQEFCGWWHTHLQLNSYW